MGNGRRWMMFRKARRIEKEGTSMRRNSHLCKALKWHLIIVALLFAVFIQSDLYAFTLKVVDSSGNPIVGGFRWLLEEDTTFPVTPGARVSDSLAVNIFKSHSPVAANGSSTTSTAAITAPDSTKRYFLSVLPNSGYTMSGASINAGLGRRSTVTVTVNPLPLPTAQISILVFHDNNPINNAPDIPFEEGLEGFSVLVFDQLGKVSQDAFANPLGTTYLMTCDATGQNPGTGTNACVDVDGNPIVNVMGNGNITTNARGEAFVKYLAPGKYGIRVVPTPDKFNWSQTATIEGTPGIDAWVKAKEPPFLVEFGPTFQHVFIGFIEPANNIPAGGTGSITGQIVRFHSARPPLILPTNGVPIGEAWVGLNSIIGPLSTTGSQGMYAAPCDANGFFTIPNVPPGTYQIVIWDTPLDYIFGFYTVIVPPGAGGTGDPVNAGQLGANAWFGNWKGSVFSDDGGGNPTKAGNAFRDPGEAGISNHYVNIRFRDGSLYQSTVTDVSGEYQFAEVFPFFKWLTVDIDFDPVHDTIRTPFAVTGATITVDQGSGPAGTEINPQPQLCTQADVNAGYPGCTAVGAPLINPNTGDNLSRTEVASFGGEVLSQAMMLFADQTNTIDWGKKAHDPGKNGGISGIVNYATTRTEQDPRFAKIDRWEPFIPRVQACLYRSDGAGNIVHPDGTPAASGNPSRLCDVDNYPFQWAPQYRLLPDGSPNPIWTGRPGPEDVNRNRNRSFDPGDALQIAWTSSWDDNFPSGCVYTLPEQRPLVNGQLMLDCAETLRTWNQVRPGEFDGVYNFHSYFPGGMASGSTEVEGIPPGTYIVQAVPPKGYEIAKEEDWNIVFGETYIPSPLLLAPVCVGDPHTVPQYLSIFPDQQVPAPFAGQTRPLCDRKQIDVVDGRNSRADFHFFTMVPRAAHVVGLITNDLANVLNQNNPLFGEKLTPSWLPVSFQDYQGNEITRVYTDEFGAYNTLLPSTFTINPPIPTGVSPNMVTVCLNHPGPIRNPGNQNQFITDPYFNPNYSQTCLNFDFWPGKTTILDTPVIPSAAFTGATNTTLDCEFPDGTPVIYSVSGPTGGPYVSASGTKITITAVGTIAVPNPAYNPDNPGTTPPIINRDFGFGSVKGKITVGGMELTNVTWAADGKTISGVVPTGMQTGQLVVTRGDNKKSSVMGVTLTVGAVTDVVNVSAGQSIQNAINNAPTGALILVGPGVYANENIIIWKNVTLQGWGAPSTIINGSPFPAQKISSWQTLLATLVGNGTLGNLITGQDPTFKNEEAPGIMVLVKDGEFTSTSRGRLDGFTVMGANQGGAIYVNAYAHYYEISNNKIINNLGNLGGGIRIGNPSLVNPLDNTKYLSSQNDHISIHHNHVEKNGGINGGAGISLYNGSNNYQVAVNYICGNFTSSNGAGINHLGLSDQGLIQDNWILLNEAFYGAATGGEAGGIYIGGQTPPAGAPVGTLTQGSGNVTVNANLIQNNLAGSGDGGGIRTNLVNGQDVLASPGNPTNWYAVNIFNNMIVNNISGLAGGGIALKETAKARIINNTIADNDSTASGINAFLGGAALPSTPQVAGIVSRAHSNGLRNAIGAGIGPEFSDFSNPVLVNNIIWHNRSFYFDPIANGGLGALLANPTLPYWDLQVTDTPTPETMDPEYCILTNTAGYAGTNIMVAPDFPDLFADPFSNALQFASVAQEGGNFVNITFTPLTLRGDYHITPVLSPAIDTGTDSFLATFPELQKDYDGGVRPFAIRSDIGADEDNGQKVLLRVTITGTIGGSGHVTSSPAGINCGTDCREIYDVGTTVSLTATSDLGSVLGGWSGDATGTATTIAVTLDTSKAVTATFIGPSLTVTTPNGGETFKNGSFLNTNKISWTYTGNPGPIKIELLKAGVLYATIKSSVPVGTNGAGSFNWRTPRTYPAGADYSIRITSVGIPSVTDTSDANFNISP